MGCDGDLVKCLVFWVNFLLALIGIVLLSVGIFYKITLEELSYAIPKDYQCIVIIPVLIIPIGTSLIALAVIGCYGSLTEKVRFLAVHCFALFFIFVIQVSIGVNAFYVVRDRENLSAKLNMTLEKAFGNYHDHKNKEVVDLIQHQLKCCGNNGSTSWDEIPRSCVNINTGSIHDWPCPTLVLDYLVDCVHVVGIVTLVLSVTEMLVSTMSFFFLSYLRSRSRRFMFIKSYSYKDDLL